MIVDFSHLAFLRYYELTKEDWLLHNLLLTYQFSCTLNLRPCLELKLCLPAAAAAAKSLQLCPTLCHPIDGLLPGSSVPGILQARTMKWVAISFSNAWKGKVKVKPLSCVWLLATSWTAAYQAPPSMEFSRQESWHRVPLLSPNIVFTNLYNEQTT